MQVFLINSSPLNTAIELDAKRLNKQVLECDWMLNSTEGSRVRNHPIYKMYKDEMDWVGLYRNCLRCYRDHEIEYAEQYDKLALSKTPKFLNQQYFDNFKKRLYTKDPVFYKKYERYGTTEENWYHLDGTWYIYNGGRIGELEDINGILTPKYY